MLMSGSMQCGAHEIINHGEGFCSFLPSEPRPEWREGAPATDGVVVYCNCATCSSPGEYTARCGDNVHELAHYEFKTVQWSQKKVKGRTVAQRMADGIGRPKLEWLAHECINVCVDIADETRIEMLMPGVGGQLRIGNLLASRRLNQMVAPEYGMKKMDKKTGQFEDGLPFWRACLLCLIGHYRLSVTRSVAAVRGHWLVDCGYGHRKRGKDPYFGWTQMDNLCDEFSSHKDEPFAPDFDLLKLTARPLLGQEKEWVRSATGWMKILKASKTIFQEIARILKDEDAPSGPGKGKPGTGTPVKGKEGKGKPGEGTPVKGEPGEGEGKPGEGKGEGKPGEGEVKSGDGNGPVSPSETGDAEEVEGGCGSGDPNKDMRQAAMKQSGKDKEACGCSSGGQLTMEIDQRSIDQTVRNNARNRFRIVATQLMESQGAMVETSHVLEGDRMHRDWRQVFMGGAMFVQKQEDEGEQLNLSIILDRSGSMERTWVQVKSAAVGCIEAMTEAGAEVHIQTFHDVKRVHKSVSDLAHTALGGGTSGLGAVECGMKWLGDRAGKRMMLIMTDGYWCDTKHAVPLIRTMMNRGWGVALIGLDLTEEDMRGHGWQHPIPCMACTAMQFPNVITTAMSKVMFSS